MTPVYSEGSLPFIPPLAAKSSSADQRDRIAVLGLGNVLLSDEGAGVYAAASLAASYSFSPPVDIIDGGTLGLDLLPYFQGRDRIVIIDAVDLKKTPGHIQVLAQEAISSVLNVKMSTHHIGLRDLLACTLLTCDTPPQVTLVGIQPYSLSMAVGLSPQLLSRWQHFMDRIIAALQEWNTVISPAAVTLNNRLSNLV